MDGNDIGWRAWAATGIGVVQDGSADNGSNGVHYEGGLGELRFLESQANNNEVGILVDGDVTFFTQCAEVKDNSLKGLSMYNGSILDLSSYPVNDDPAQLDASNNENTITLNQAANLRLSGGNNDLRPASPGYGDVVYGSLTVNCSTTIDGLGNAWNASGSAPVQGQGVNDNYYVTGLGGSCLITISDPSPEDPATCGDSDIDGGELVDPLFDCSECESVTIYINPAIDGPDGNGSPQTLPLNESLQSAMEEMRRYDDLNGDDLEATWRMLQLLEHSYTSISIEEAYLLDLAYESMKRAFSSAIAHDEVQLGDGNSEPNNNLDDLTTAITDYLDIEIQASPAYQDGLRYHTDQAIIYQALGYRDEALGYFDDAKDWASSSDDPPIDTWICLLNHEQDLVDGQITIQQFFDVIDNCAGGGSSRIAAPAGIAEPSLEAIEATRNLLVYPNPAEYSITIEIQQAAQRNVVLSVLDMQGKVVKVLLNNQILSKGKNIFTFKTDDWAQGLYLLKFNDGLNTFSEKLIIAK